VARAAPWLALLAVYVAALLALDPGGAGLQSPRLLELLPGGVGGDLARLLCAAAAAGACAAAASAARQWVPEPWATRTVLMGGLSPAGLALAADTSAVPALLLTAGLALALRAREHPTRPRVLGGAGCLALAPWFGTAYAAPAAAVLLALVAWTFRRGHRLDALLALELAGATVVALAGVTVSRSAGAAPGPDGILAAAAQAPAALLALPALVLLARSRRSGVSRAVPARRDAEVGAALTAVAVGALAAAAAVAPIGPEAGVPLAAALGAWAARALPAAGLLAALATAALTTTALVALAAGDAAGWLR
jgi:hypothetical protein